MNVNARVARLRLVTDDFALADAWRAEVLERLDPARLIAGGMPDSSPDSYAFVFM